MVRLFLLAIFVLAASAEECADKLDRECTPYLDRCTDETVQYWCAKSCGKCGATKAPTTTTTDSGTKHPTKPGCQDTGTNCAQLADSCDVRDVQVYCPLTCKLCTPTTAPPPKCEDKSAACQGWAKAGACAKVKLACKESCGLCN